MKSLLRVLTILCYFFPITFFVVTCNGLELKVAYNNKEAKENELEGLAVRDSMVNIDSPHTDAYVVIDTSGKGTLENKVYNDSLQSKTTSNTNDDFWKKVFKIVIIPTNNSLSGIGSIFYFKNLAGRLLIAVCFLISLSVLIVWQVLKRKNLILYFFIGNTLCLIAFIAVSFISNVELHWGVWVLLLLILLQFIMEKKTKSVESNSHNPHL